MRQSFFGALKHRLLSVLTVTLLVAGLVPMPVASAAQACPCTIWPSTAAPDIENTGDGEAESKGIEVGIKFTADVAGSVTGIRFYKGSQNTGTHTGSLWTESGTKLASAIFTSESASGWQQVLFDSPVAVAASTTYVASYHAPNGKYSATRNYFASTGVNNAPLHVAAGSPGVYKLGGGFPTSTYSNNNYWVDVVFVDGAAPADTTAPTVVSTVPGEDTVDVPVNNLVSATFNEALASGSATASSFTVQDNTGVPVVGAVTYNPTTFAVTFDPDTDLAANTAYTAALKGGASGIKDTAGNALAADYSWTFTTAAAPTPNPTPGECPCSLWSGADIPQLTNVSEGIALELGIKFTASKAGSIRAIKFYKSAHATGTRTVSLWNTQGTLLATATVTGESPNGWQVAALDAPVAVEADTTYIASYLTPSGHYAANTDYFTASATTNGPLQAPMSSASGGNGVYKVGGGFPASSYRGSNYWVDVVFMDDAAPDTTAPAVASVLPASNATNISVGTDATVTFNEAVDPNTVTASTFELRDADGNVVTAQASYNQATKTATLNPSGDLANTTTYTVRIKGGDTGVKDTAGNALAADYSWSFTTNNQIPIDKGHGGPVLVITAGDKPFSKYYTEILRAEGVNAFKSADITTVTAAMLSQHDVAILGEMPLTDAQVSMFTDWVTAGGNLVAMRPDKKLASLLGLADQNSTMSNAYLQIDTNKAPGKGIASETMQFHGSADKYSLQEGTSAVATLFTNAQSSTDSPAVTLRSVGSAGGQATAFTYDLARSVVYTRQGNPAWAGQDRDNNGVIRPNDLFYGNEGGDPQPDWVDLNKVAIPQADEQQRLLANLVSYINQDRTPIPKFWYFPKGEKAVMVMAADDHATSAGTKSHFNRMLANSPASCDVTNWECARSTSWVYTNSNLSNTEAAEYHAQGFDMGVHVDSGCSNWTQASLESAYAAKIAEFRTKFTSLPPQEGHRVHCIAWSDWATQPKVELSYGMRMDLNYYYWPGAWVQNRPGFMTGSGIPMRFADLDGSMIDVYQNPSHLVNESGMTFPAAIEAQLDKALGPEGYYGAFGTHYDFSDQFDIQLMDAAIARGVPLVSVKQMLDWTDGRNNSVMNQVSWNGNTLQFTASVDSRTGTMLRGMLPLHSAKGTLAGITKDGTPVNFTTETIKGVAYALFPASTGAYAATYSNDPLVLSTTPAKNAVKVATTTTVNATFNKNMDNTTINDTTFELRGTDNVLVDGTVSYNTANNSLTFVPAQTLGLGKTYTATVKGGATGVKDTEGVAMAANHTWSFTTDNPLACPCSLWPDNATPAILADSDTNAVELGVKFKASVSGHITGIRFYKSSQNTGVHTGSLWASDGTKLATVTFSNETGSGWQTAYFDQPVAVSADTTYVASYFAPAGRYSATGGQFTSSHTAGPLQALASDASGGNGVYQYGGGFPTSSYNNTNYWVDVVFQQ